MSKVWFHLAEIHFVFVQNLIARASFSRVKMNKFLLVMNVCDVMKKTEEKEK